MIHEYCRQTETSFSYSATLTLATDRYYRNFKCILLSDIIICFEIAATPFPACVLPTWHFWDFFQQCITFPFIQIHIFEAGNCTTATVLHCWILRNTVRVAEGEVPFIQTSSITLTAVEGGRKILIFSFFIHILYTCNIHVCSWDIRILLQGWNCLLRTISRNTALCENWRWVYWFMK